MRLRLAAILPPPRETTKELPARRFDPRAEPDEPVEVAAGEVETPDVDGPDDDRSHVRRSDFYPSKGGGSLAELKRNMQGVKDLREEQSLIGVETSRARLYIYVAPRLGKKKPAETGT